MAAVRSLSVDHPVFELIDRLAYQTFAIRISVSLTRGNEGGPVDELFLSNCSLAAKYANDLYRKGSGDWANVKFTTDLAQPRPDRLQLALIRRQAQFSRRCTEGPLICLVWVFSKPQRVLREWIGPMDRKFPLDI